MDLLIDLESGILSFGTVASHRRREREREREREDEGEREREKNKSRFWHVSLAE